MHKKSKICVFILFGLVAGIPAPAQYKTAVDTIPSSLVKTTVTKFANHLSAQNLRDLGLKNMEELLALKPGIQYGFLMMGLEGIKKYKQGDDVTKLIKEFSYTEVALTDNSAKIRLSVNYVKRNNNWTVASFGLTPEFGSIGNLQQSSWTNIPKKNALIRVPALEASFIAFKTPQGELKFMTLRADPAYGFKPGQIQTASAAILKLAEMAKHYK